MERDAAGKHDFAKLDTASYIIIILAKTNKQLIKKYMAQQPQHGDGSFNLLYKIADNTYDISQGGGGGLDRLVQLVQLGHKERLEVLQELPELLEVKAQRGQLDLLVAMAQLV